MGFNLLILITMKNLLLLLLVGSVVVSCNKEDIPIVEDVPAVSEQQAQDVFSWNVPVDQLEDELTALFVETTPEEWEEAGVTKASVLQIVVIKGVAYLDYYESSSNNYEKAIVCKAIVCKGTGIGFGRCVKNWLGNNRGKCLKIWEDKGTYYADDAC